MPPTHRSPAFPPAAGGKGEQSMSPVRHSCHTPLEQHPREQWKDGASTATLLNTEEHPLLSGNRYQRNPLAEDNPLHHLHQPHCRLHMPFGFFHMPELHLCWHLCPHAEDGSTELVPRDLDQLSR